MPNQRASHGDHTTERRYLGGLQKLDPELYDEAAERAVARVWASLEAGLAGASPAAREAVARLDVTLEPDTNVRVAIREALARMDLPEEVRTEASSAIDATHLPVTPLDLLADPTEEVLPLPEIARARVVALSRAAGLDEDTIERVVARAPRPEAITNDILAAMVDDGDLDEDAALDLGLAASLHHLADGDESLIRAVREVQFPGLPGGLVRSPRDLVALDTSTWLHVLETADADPPDGVSRAGYAATLAERVARLFPTDSLLTRLQGTGDAVLEAVERLTPLLDRNDEVTSRGFDALDLTGLDADEIAALRDQHAVLAALTGSFPGLGLADVFDDRSVTPADRVEEASRRIALLDRVQAMNQDVDLLGLDLALDGQGQPALRFDGILDEDRERILQTLRAQQRVLALAGDVATAQAVLQGGYSSALSVARSSTEEVAERTGLTGSEAADVRADALATMAEVTAVFGGILDAATDGVDGVGITDVRADARDYLRRLPGYRELFGSQAYCSCEHCASILSPAAYFVDLMLFVDEHVTRPVFAPHPDHPLSLPSRRPDLWSTSLTCANTTESLATLELVNEVLENHLATANGYAGPLADRAGVQAAVYGHLASSTASFDQPFVLPLARLRGYLEHAGVSRARVARTLEAPAAAVTAAALETSEVGRRLIATRNVERSFLRTVYGLDLPIEDGIVPPFDVQRLLTASSLTRQELGQIIAARWVRAGGAPLRIRSEKTEPSSVQNDIERVHGLTLDALDRIHRFTRLWRRLPWQIGEVDLVLTSLGATTLTEGELDRVVAMTTLAERIGVSAEEVCALTGLMPRQRVDDATPALFDRLLNAAPFVSADGELPKDRTVFVHPALRDVEDDGTPDQTAHRLWAALGVDDDSLLRLITDEGLAPALGIDPTDTTRGFTLTADHLSVLYRHARLAQLLRLPVAELLRLMSFVPALSTGHVTDVDDVATLLDFRDWQATSGYSLDDLAVIRQWAPENRGAYADHVAITDSLHAEIVADSALTFAATVFAFLPGMTEEASRQLIAANQERFTAVDDGYQLAVGFRLAEPLTVTDDLPPSWDEAEARAALAVRHPSQVLPSRLAGKLGIPADKVRALVTLSGEDLSDGAIPAALCERPGGGYLGPIEPLRGFVERLVRMTAVFKADAWGPADIAFVAAHPSIFGIADVHDLPIAALQRLSAYARFRSRPVAGMDRPDPTVGADLRGILGSFDRDTKSFTAPAEQLNRFLDADPGLVRTVAAAVPLPSEPIDALGRLAAAVALARMIGVSGDDLAASLSDDYATLQRAADATLGALRARTPEQDWRSRLEPLDATICEQRRDALADHLLHTTFAQFETRADLYDHFLVDVEMTGCARTSRVAAAISSVQLYVHRVLMNLEKDRRDPDDPHHLRIDATRIPASEWGWRKNYRVWEANRKVFLWPENYLEPTLRDDKTPLFEALESTLLQQSASEQHVLDAYADYLAGFDELAGLRIAGTYHEKDPTNAQDVLHLIGVTSSDPPTYYHRPVGNARGQTEPGQGTVWSPWHKIDVQIGARVVDPIVVNGRLHLFWLECVTQPKHELENGTSTFVGYDHTLALQFTARRLDGRWTPPQRVRVGSFPPFVDGVVTDRLVDKVPKLDATNTIHAEPRQGYTLQGAGWSRPYPMLVDGSRLAVTLAGFERQRRVDLFDRNLPGPVTPSPTNIPTIPLLHARPATTAKPIGDAAGAAARIGWLQGGLSLRSASIDAMPRVWSDQGSGASSDGAFYTPDVVKLGSDYSGYYFLGSYGQGNYRAPSRRVWLVKDVGGRGALRQADDFTLIWTDRGSGARRDGSFWLPTCRDENYVALGAVCVTNYGKPDPNRVRVALVHKSLTVAGRIGQAIWTDRRSGARRDFSAWTIDKPDIAVDDATVHLAPGTFVGVASHNKPQVACYVLKLPAAIHGEVDTSGAGHEVTPVYVTSLAGASEHGTLTRTSAIYDPKPRSFRIRLRRPLGEPPTQQEANVQDWTVNWVALPPGGPRSGNTSPSDWQRERDGVYCEVDTSGARLDRTPVYLTAISGVDGHETLTGPAAVHAATPTGFRIHLRRPGGPPPTQEEAIAQNWTINWVALPQGPRSGSSSPSDWKVYSDGIYCDVDTSSARFDRTPVYLTAVRGETGHDSLTGASAIYDANSTGFRVYLCRPVGPTPTPKEAEDAGWIVQWTTAEHAWRSATHPYQRELHPYLDARYESYPLAARNLDPETSLLTSDQGADGPEAILSYDPAATIEVVNGSLSDVLVDHRGDLLLLQLARSDSDPPQYRLRRIGTTLGSRMSRILLTGGFGTLLDTATQRSLVEAPLPVYRSATVADEGAAGSLDYVGAFGTHFQEIFHHIPELLATHLSSQQQFSAAQQWFHYLFDPNAGPPIGDASGSTHGTTGASNGESEQQAEQRRRDRPWRYLRFQGLDVTRLQAILTDGAAIAAYKRDPFNPHAIARLRISAYQKSLVMRYIDNLLDWGDSLFTQFTTESVNEATLHYAMAAAILGDRPPQLGPCDDTSGRAMTFEDLAPLTAEGGEFLVDLEDLVHRQTAPDMAASPPLAAYVASPARIAAAKAEADAQRVRTVLNKAQTVSPEAELPTLEVQAATLTSPGGLGEIGPDVARGVDELAGDEGVGGAAFASAVHSMGVSKEGWNKACITSWIGTEGGNGAISPQHEGPAANATIIDAAAHHALSLVRQSRLFCIPVNPELLARWSQVEDRLTKIRHCRDIDGVPRQPELFAPEIDPRMLVRARAAGLSLDDVLNATAGTLPPYRFTYLIDRAKDHAALVQAFGAALLDALEKKDLEELNRLRLVQQQDLLRLDTKVRQWEIDTATITVAALEHQREAVKARRDHLRDLTRSGRERKQQRLLIAEAAMEGGAGGLDIFAGANHLVPEVGSPFAMKFGGKQLGSSAEAFSNALGHAAATLHASSEAVGLEAVFRRREEDWKHEAAVAEMEIEGLGKELEAAKIRREIAKRAQRSHQEALEQLDETFDHYANRFSHLGLYTWLASTLQRVYRRAYGSAYAMARLAEQAYRFERGDDTSELLSPSYWDAARAGLLAGERLQVDLQQMERRFLETNHRSLEIDQPFRLTLLDPAALIRLREEGTCEFDIPEVAYDLAYPGNYRRRITSVRVTIPCVAGPYSNVGATLTLLSSRLRQEPSLDAPLRPVPVRRSVSIATSTAREDPGVFEFSFRDERYMPFEGAGAVSRWRLRLPKTFRAFDYRTITDVILHVSYTAEADDLLRTKVEGHNARLAGAISTYLTENPLVRLFSLRKEHAEAFEQLLHQPVGTVVPLRFEQRFLPMFLQGLRLHATEAKLVLATAGKQVGDVGFTFDGAPVTGFLPDTDLGQLPSADLTGAMGEDFLREHTVAISSWGDLASKQVAGEDAPARGEERLEDILVYVAYGLKRP